MSWWLCKDRITIHLKPDQIEDLPEAMNGGGVTKRASSFIYIFPSTYTGDIFGFINFEQLNPIGIMVNTNLTNQRQVFVEEYVRSGVNH